MVPQVTKTASTIPRRWRAMAATPAAPCGWESGDSQAAKENEGKQIREAACQPQTAEKHSGYHRTSQYEDRPVHAVGNESKGELKDGGGKHENSPQNPGLCQRKQIVLDQHRLQGGYQAGVEVDRQMSDGKQRQGQHGYPNLADNRHGTASFGDGFRAEVERRSAIQGSDSEETTAGRAIWAMPSLTTVRLKVE